MQADLAAIRRKFEQSDDNDLLRVAHAGEEDYIPEVVALARDELDRRGVDYAKPEVEAGIVETLAREREEKRTHAGSGLSPIGCVGCAIAGILISLIVAAVMMSNGRKRAAQDAIFWCMCGMAVKLALAGLAAVLV